MFNVLLLSVICFLGSAISNPAYEGEWHLQVSGKFEEDAEVLLNLTSTSDSTLTGVLRSCCGGNWRITIDFSSAVAGEVFLTALAEGEEPSEATEPESDGFGEDADATARTSVLEFELRNRTNGYTVASGPFAGEGKGQYHLIIATPLTFVFSLVDKDGAALTITGRKEVRVVDGGFWSRFPSPMMMVGIMLLSQWLKPRMPDPGAAAQAGQRGQAARAEARVTDVTEEEGVQ